MIDYILIALKDLKYRCNNKGFCFLSFLKLHNLHVRFYNAVLKIGLIKEIKIGRHYKYYWIVDEPTINDAKFIKSYL